MVKEISLNILNNDLLLRINADENKEFLLVDSFQIFKANEYLRNLNTGLVIKFEGFSQYYKLIQSIAKKLNIPFNSIFSLKEEK